MVIALTNSEDTTSSKSINLQLSAKVIQHISSGLYRSNASALKELVMNSFDAGATETTISFFYKMEEKSNATLLRLEVKDNGKGISAQDLEKALTHIGYSLKLENLEIETEDYIDESNFGRPLIGRLGIGMFAIVSACNNFTIYTKQKEDSFETVAKINVSDFENIREKTESFELFSVGTAEIESKENDEKGPYTKFVITDFKRPFLQTVGEKLKDNYVVKKFQRKELFPNNENLHHHLLEQVFTDFIEQAQKNSSIKNMGQLDQLIWNLSNMLPIQYTRDGPIKRKIKFGNSFFEVYGRDDSYFDTLKERLTAYNFNVFISIEIEETEHTFNTEGSPAYPSAYIKLYRPMLLPSQQDIDRTVRSMKKQFTNTNEDQFDELCFKSLYPRVVILKQNLLDPDYKKRKERISGFIYHQNVRIHPFESRLLVHRVYDVAIGDPTDEFLRENVSSPLTLWQSTGEILLDRGFQGSLNIDRESLYQASDPYQYAYYLIKKWLSQADIEAEQGEVKEKSASESEVSKTRTETELYSKGSNPPAARIPVLELFKRDQEERILVRKEISKSKPRPLTVQKSLEKIAKSFDVPIDKVSLVHRQDAQSTKLIREHDRLKLILPEFKKQEDLWTAIFISVASTLVESSLEPIRKKLEETLFKIYEEQ